MKVGAATASRLVSGGQEDRTAMAMARAGHWVYDVARDEFLFNDNFYRIFRCTAEDVGGYTMSAAEYGQRFCDPDDAYVVASEIGKSSAPRATTASCPPT